MDNKEKLADPEKYVALDILIQLGLFLRSSLAIPAIEEEDAKRSQAIAREIGYMVKETLP